MSTVETIWRPLAGAIADKRAALGRPALIGVSGPQGCGKSTGCVLLSEIFAREGLRCATVSLDDFYRTKAERAALAATIHPLFATRGPPGTHDVALGEATTARLLAGESFAPPRFAKARDDRAPERDWPRFEGPADIVILEGWCVGAEPQPAEALATPVNALEREEDPQGVWRAYANAALEHYARWFDTLDFRIHFRAPDFAIVKSWRLEQEQTLRADRGDAAGQSYMTAPQIDRFVQHYERWTRAMDEGAASPADAVIQLGSVRELVSFTLR